ncbi:MAG TPA: zinc-dependent alcohol dehydrogenase family protein [Holophagaceae bacterium]|nr:zinc-dependent alcohol dehydrogenase family protein [Holophagaceae bacterium]
MRALRFSAPGNPLDALALEALSLPDPGPGEVRLRMRLCPINPSDLLQVQGVYGRMPGLPATAGLEGLGVVEALGEGVTGWALGDRAVPLGAQGTWAEALVTPSENLVRVPDGLADDQAAQVIVNPLTAWIMAHQLGLGRGQTLLQSAAGSIVGRALIQLGKVMGFRTVNLVRRPEQVMELLSLGADAVVCTEDPEWLRQMARFLPQGADAAVDAVGGALGGEMVKLLAPGGTMLVYGALSMEPLQLPGGQLIFRTATVRGFWLTDWKRRTPKAERDAICQALLACMAEGKVVCPVAGIHPLEGWRNAVRQALTPGRGGKVLLSMQG